MIEPPESFARRVPEPLCTCFGDSGWCASMHVPAGDDRDHCDMCGLPFEPRPGWFRRFCSRRTPGPFDWPVFGICCVVIALLPLWLWFDLGRW